MASVHPTPSLDVAIEGSRRERFLIELFGNSAIFPLANILLELFQHDVLGDYFLEQHFYTMCTAAIAQAAYLSGGNGRVRVFAGNLIGPAIYTVVEAIAEGPVFFTFLHHYEYWMFAGAIGGLQALRERVTHERLGSFLMIAEAVTRSSILLAMYVTFEIETTPADASGAKPAFLDDRSHTFIAWTIMLLGVVAGVSAATSHRYLSMLRGLSRQLRTYSEWFFGRTLLQQVVSDPGALALARQDRAILFMDMRGFTAWSETQPPETVVAGLGAYYLGAEEVFARIAPIRSKFSADEIMAVFARPADALAAARELARTEQEALRARGLAAGVGLHWGPVVEGLIGGLAVKQFDVVGDTVNTAKRIEGAAAPGEILASEAFRAVVGAASAGEMRIEVKGKAVPLTVHRLAPLTAIKTQEASASVT